MLFFYQVKSFYGEIVIFKGDTMKNFVKKSLLAVTVAMVGMGTAMADTAFPAGFKVGVVDVSAVVAKSAQVQVLRAEQQQKLEELQKWLDTVRADVAKQQTKEGQEKLIKKYDVDFAKKQETIKRDYAKKLQSIDKSISQTIAEQAKAQNYDMIFAKGTVLYGGDDITESVLKVVK